VEKKLKPTPQKYTENMFYCISIITTAKKKLSNRAIINTVVEAGQPSDTGRAPAKFYWGAKCSNNDVMMTSLITYHPKYWGGPGPPLPPRRRPP